MKLHNQLRRGNRGEVAAACFPVARYEMKNKSRCNESLVGGMI